jgi:DNA-binding NarL/FixJ family response regulator
MRPSDPNASLVLPSGVRWTLELLATGLYTDDVADRLCTDPDTIRQYIAEARAMLGARSKLEAVVIALRLGLIDPTQGERFRGQGT